LAPPTTTAPPKPTAPRTPPPTALQSSLGKLFGKAGPNSGGEVYDLSTGKTLFALRAGVMRPPASVEKLYTTVALLRDLGPNAAFQTTLLGAGHLGRGGVWHGDLYLKGGGDPTFGDDRFNLVWNHGYGPSSTQLVGQLRTRGITRVTGHVIADESLFDSARGGPSTNYAPDIGDYGGQLSALTYDHGSTNGPGTVGGKLSPAVFAVKELVLTMRAQHIRAKAAPATGVTPAGAQQLAAVTSPPVSTLIGLMDVSSDDLFADLLTKQLGVRFGGGAGTISAGANVIAAAVATYGLHPAVIDGSGLSRDDSSAPAHVVGLLRRIWRTPIGNELSSALPVVGVSGTVAGVGVHTPAQGRCIAKTGTLAGVTNLAGYCTNRTRHVLAFALFVDGPPNSSAMKMLGQMVGAIAR
jgi:D-alanyl-D-alanine carboxypeptidase/D-alanyl-D-alanine-endopeptidase (penicillin-binding protein 4)